MVIRQLAQRSDDVTGVLDGSQQSSRRVEDTDDTVRTACNMN